MEKIAVLAPIARARVATTTAVKPGVLPRLRIAYFRSWITGAPFSEYNAYIVASSTAHPRRPVRSCPGPVQRPSSADRRAASSRGPSFAPKRPKRIDARRPPSRQVGRGEVHDGEEQGHAAEGQRIGGADAEEEGRQKPRDAERRGQSDHQADRCGLAPAGDLSAHNV